MTEIVIALTTVPADFDADALGQALVEARVAACVSVLGPIRSTYAWQGAIETAAEQQLVIKTRADLVDALWTELRAKHPYDTPEFLVLPVIHGNTDYLSWIRAATRAPD